MYDQYLENTKKPRTPKESKGKKPKKHAELPAEDEFEGISRLPQLPKGFKPRVDATLEEIVNGSDFEEEEDDSDEDSPGEDIKEEEEDDEEDDKSKLKIPNSKRAAMWFSQPIFDDLLDDSKVPEIAVKDAPANNRKAKKRGRNDVDLSIVKKEEPEEGEEGQEEDERKDKKKKKKKMEREMEMVMPTTQELDDMEMEVVKADNYDDGENSSDYDSDDLKETLALGTYAVRNRRFSHMIDDAYNRYAWNEDEKSIPKWFLDDENKHNKPTLPVTKEIMQEIRERFKAVDARPTKKVVEAKARKKMKAVKKSEKVKQQAVAVAGNGELSTKEKMRQIEKLYKGQVNKMKPDSVYVVAKKASGRIRGSGKGKRVKVVDPRMKKDKRAIKNIEKKSKGKGGKGGKGKGKGRGGGGRKG
jgi:AdoMet-dependent rRNA methyltransferase SPB1